MEQSKVYQINYYLRKMLYIVYVKSKRKNDGKKDADKKKDEEINFLIFNNHVFRNNILNKEREIRFSEHTLRLLSTRGLPARVVTNERNTVNVYTCRYCDNTYNGRGKVDVRKITHSIQHTQRTRDHTDNRDGYYVHGAIQRSRTQISWAYLIRPFMTL